MTSFQDVPPENILKFDVIREKLDVALEACALKLEREWPQRLAHQGLLRLYLIGVVRAAANTYNTLRFFLAEKPANDARRPDFAFSAPPLTRTMLDSVFQVTYLFEDIEARWDVFRKSGWRELYEELQRYRTVYGSDPAWTHYLRETSQIADWMKNEAHVTAAEVANLKLVPYFPNPGKMPGRCTDPARKAYLTHLNDWFYKDLSAVSHLSLIGFVKGAGQLARPREEWEALLPKVRSNNFLTADGAVGAVVRDRADVRFWAAGAARVPMAGALRLLARSNGDLPTPVRNGFCRIAGSAHASASDRRQHGRLEMRGQIGPFEYITSA